MVDILPPTNKGDFYLYRHIRLDSNEVFYVGIGMVYSRDFKSKSLKKYFCRAFSKRGRNKIWQRITSKSEYRIEVLFVSKDSSLINELEKSLISYYGRIDLKTGSLACLTDGGEGTVNISIDGRKRISKAAKVRAANQDGDKNTNSIEVFVYDIDGNYLDKYQSLIQAQKNFGLKYDSRIFSRKYTNPAMYYKGYQWSKSYLGEKISPKIMSENKKKQYGYYN